jgi:hypothetical protein
MPVRAWGRAILPFGVRQHIIRRKPDGLELASREHGRLIIVVGRNGIGALPVGENGIRPWYTRPELHGHYPSVAAVGGALAVGLLLITECAEAAQGTAVASHRDVDIAAAYAVHIAPGHAGLSELAGGFDGVPAQRLDRFGGLPDAPQRLCESC